MGDESGPEAVVSVPVPVGALPLVHEVLARYYRATARGAEMADGVPVPGSPPWNRRELEALARLVRRSPLWAIVGAVARARGERVSYGALAQAADVELPRLRALLAWLSKYGAQVKGSKAWPMAVTTNSNKPAEERHQYWMPEPLASWWLEIEAEQEG